MYLRDPSVEFEFLFDTTFSCRWLVISPTVVVFHEVRTGTVIEVGRVLHVYTLDYTTSHIKANVKL